jgi:hypothetical protein
LPNRTVVLGVAATLVLAAGSAGAYTPLGHIGVPYGGKVREVELDGDRAVLLARGLEGKRGLVRVVDISNPRRLREIGAIVLDVTLNGLAAVDGIAFVASKGGGKGHLHVLDLSRRGDPERIAKLRFPAPAREVEVANGFDQTPADDES